jgi:hypothetical protein
MPVSQDIGTSQAIEVERKLRAGEPLSGLSVQEPESKRQTRKDSEKGAGKPSGASVILDITVTYGESRGTNKCGHPVGLPAFENKCRKAPVWPAISFATKLP